MEKVLFSVRLPQATKDQLQNLVERMNQAEPDRQYKYSMNHVAQIAIEEFIKAKDKQLRKQGF